MTGSSPRSSCQTSFLHLLKSQYLCSGRPVRQNRLVGSKYQKSIYLSVSSAVEQDRNREKKSLVVSTIFQPKEVSMFAMTKWKFLPWWWRHWFTPLLNYARVMFVNTNEYSLGSYKGLHPFGLKSCTLGSGIGIWDPGWQGLSI